MERRKNFRLPIHLDAEFHVLGREASRVPGRVQDVSESGLRLTTLTALVPGMFLRIVLEDSVVFGEVRYCCPWVGGYVSGLLVEQMLLGTSELSKLIAASLPQMGHLPGNDAILIKEGARGTFGA